MREPGLGRIATYLDTLATWNARINLTGARSPRERVQRLIGDVLPALDHVLPGRLIDVGSGNGSPGLVIALLRTDVLDVALLEPRVRRWAFLQEVARRTGAPHVRPVRSRHDAYDGPPAATVTIRALALSLEALEPLVAREGRVIVFGSRPTPSPFFTAEDEREGFSVFRRRPRGVPRET